MTAWDHEFDVVVVGSGAAGLTAAIFAADGGARVAVLERSDKYGGSSAVSGGMIWVPLNHHMDEVGIPDSREEAMTYLNKVTMGQSDPDMLELYVKTMADVIRYLEARTPVRTESSPVYPDYHPEWPGGKTGGRSLDNKVFDTKVLGDEMPRLRRSPVFPPFTVREWEDWGLIQNFDFNLIGQRMQDGIATMGSALVGALLKGCLDRGVKLFPQTRLTGLTRNGTVEGVIAERDGRPLAFRARKGVILACGGFEWNKEMEREFLRGPEMAPASPPWNTGDGIIAGMEVGARIGLMNEAWWMPMVRVPGEELDGHMLFRLLLTERTFPGSIIVNRKGQRFVDEAYNYNDMVKAFHTFDPVAYEYPNIPAYLVFDEEFRQRYAVVTAMPGEPVPSWITSGETLADLAGKLGIDAAGLQETVAGFNQPARAGKDPEFHRGESYYETYYGDKTHPIHPCVAPVDKPPFYAVEVIAGCLGTKGGLKTNAHGQVLDLRSRPIEGLYACGNVTASIMGPGYAGAGATLGPGMCFGYLAARHAVSREA
ncbi:MAG TPA: FAD-dependent oxidoreductase [Symbiobacteriaceae bacterium]